MWPNDSAFSHTPPHTHLKGCKEGGGGWIVGYFLKKLDLSPFHPRNVYIIIYNCLLICRTTLLCDVNQNMTNSTSYLKQCLLRNTP